MAVKYPVGDSDFVSIRQGGYAYVDKTALIYQLTNTSGKYFFLSRPRRFGKSLLLSTLEAYFRGEKNLFEGLAIAQLEQEWRQYPVLHLDFSPKTYNRLEALVEHLSFTLELWEEIYSLPHRPELALEERFTYIILTAARRARQQVVLLIDEYDAPLLDTVAKPQLHDRYREQLRGFYKVIKAQAANLRFVMITGITKFAQVSIFSALNNLDDISFNPQYATICGITQQELEDNLADGIEKVLTMQRQLTPNLTREGALKLLKDKYDGYHFSYMKLEDADGVYNPFSLLRAMANGLLEDYWYDTGTPDYLVQVMGQADCDLFSLLDAPVALRSLRDIAINASDPRPLFYQSGYLTLATYNAPVQACTLRIPNGEVECALFRFLVGAYSQATFDLGHQYGENKFVTLLEAGKPEAFMALLQGFFDICDYRAKGQKPKLPTERDFQSVLYMVFCLFGLWPHLEVRMAYGRADMVLTTPDYAYVFEFKVDSTAQAALAQIEARGYARGAAWGQRTVYAIGVNFSRAKGTITEYIVTPYSPQRKQG